MRAAVRLGIAALVSVAGALAGASACLDRPICPSPSVAATKNNPCKPQTTNIFVDTITQNAVDKIDLLFMIDNSISMADKQKVLSAAVPDLVNRLVSPNCVNADGKDPVQVTSPTDPCPPDKIREFTPISNIHIGVIMSSLGDHGDHNTCNEQDPTNPDAEQQDDHGHLIATRPRWAAALAGGAQPAQPPDPQGFLDWNPGTHQGQDINAFNNTFKTMVTASSEFGCGLESQLESIYRFLSDPNPPAQIISQPCPGTTPAQKQPCAIPQGKDTDLLAQRAAFLRPDSLVSIIMVTDENDCSIRDTQQFFYAARQDIVLPNGTSACGTNPNDRCCVSCATAKAPDGCLPIDQDPNCKATPDPKADSINLRCFNEKQRFGLDFLYPTKRYVNAFKNTQLCASNVSLDYDPANPGACPDGDGNGQPDVVSNALYYNSTGLPRPSSLVFVAGIVGVPWQDLQAKTDKDGMAYPDTELHFQTAADMATAGTWGMILGDPTASPPVAPTDVLMIESRTQRQGTDAFQHVIPGINATPDQDFGANATANHHDWGNVTNDDLMYACVFELAEARDCVQVEKADPAPGCDCGQSTQPGDFNPLCRDPASGNYGSTQYFAKGYPGLRELQVLKDYGNNSIVASICARNLKDNARQDYGYRPAVDAIVDRLKEALTGRCLPRQLAKDTTGTYPCSILEVQPLSKAPNCNTPGRGAPKSSKVIAPAKARLAEAGVCGGTTGVSCDSFSFCEIQWLPDDAGPCHKNIANPQQPAAGWCYVDPNAPGSQDDKALTAKCPPADQRIIRFVDPKSQTPAQGSQVLIACFGAQLGE